MIRYLVISKIHTVNNDSVSRYSVPGKESLSDNEEASIATLADAVSAVDEDENMPLKLRYLQWNTAVKTLTHI